MFRLANICVIGMLCVGCPSEDQDATSDLGTDAVRSDGPSVDDAGSDLGPRGVLALPHQLGLDLTKTATTKGDIGSVVRSVAQAAAFSGELDQIASLFVQPINVLNVPLDSGTKTFAGTANLGGKTFALKIDFGDFDGDEDGKPDGCSGHTAALPICLRAWLDGERYLAGRLDEHPTTEAAGAGWFMAVKVKSMPGGEAGTTVKVVYDHRKLTDRTTESHWATPADDPQLGKWATIRHLRVEQQGPSATALKTINLTDAMPSQPTALLKYLGRYKEDQTLWYGTVVAEGFFTQLGLKAFDYTCVDLSTGQTVDNSQCSAQGVGFNNIPHATPGADKDVALPSGFPPAPPF